MGYTRSGVLTGDPEPMPWKKGRVPFVPDIRKGLINKLSPNLRTGAKAGATWAL